MILASVVIKAYTIMAFSTFADEIWNMHNPRPFPAKKYELMQWEEDDFIKMKDGSYLLRHKQKADSELKEFMRKKVWIGVPKHY
tara:strand:- start:490 stop:741 length:252 start_codon:yes stop_codon:yes gene_type:complete